MLELKQSVIDEVIFQWQPMLTECVGTSGQHFKQLLNWNIAFCCWQISFFRCP